MKTKYNKIYCYFIMPYRIVQRGNDYFVVGPKRQYKRKTLEKARAYKRLLESKEKAKPAVSQKVVQKQHVVVNVNAPPRRRRGAPARTTAIAPHHTSENVIRMVPQITPMQAVEQARRAIPIREPVKDTIGDTNIIGKDLEKAVADLENIAGLIRDETFKKERNYDDRLDPSVFEPRIERTSSEPAPREVVSGRTGKPRRLSIDSEFQGATIGQLLQGDYGITDSGRQRTEATKRQELAIQRWKEQNP
jgi:hypothetical protein